MSSQAGVVQELPGRYRRSGDVGGDSARDRLS